MFSQKKILVVEDNELNRSLLCQILSSEYAVLEAENGQEALDILKQYGEGISLILLDIVMPVMDGYTFLSIVKADPALSVIPVIVTTQSDHESDEVTALSHGATDFVVKPYKPQVILHRVASIIKLRETAAMINMVQYDQLTGLYSKAFFYQQAKEILLRNPDSQYDIICSDVENFKLINDVFGVPTGDRLLCGMAGLFQNKIKGHGICGRLNSDQFVCMIDRKWEYTPEMFLTANAEINKLLEVRNIVVKWGIYSVDDRTVPVEQMCDRALLAANSIKGQYGKHFAKYDGALRDQLLKEQLITDSMESALAENQFQVYFQPKYRIKDERLVGAEALVRWIHPEWGFQSPAEFIPLFEKNGFITKLDQYVWDKTCEVLHRWDEQGFPPISISVNVSRADIYNVDLTDILMKTIEKYSLSPARLHLEITESAYTEDPKQIIDTVGHLRELGFIIEMDDFGSGYSSLNMLNEMPIDILKLDMKFIQSETAKPNSRGILQFIINLANEMNLSVVAEGVETKEQLNRLMAISCDYVQGYYFARPMPCGEFEELLRELDSSVSSMDTKESLQSNGLPVLLIADEDETYQDGMKLFLQEYYQLIEAGTCQEALECIKKRRDIAAVVLSLTLPGADPMEILATIQQVRKMWRLPVIATASPDPELECRVLRLGADDFLSKPYFAETLLKRLQRTVSAAANQQKMLQLQESAYRDHLTGVLNRRGLEASQRALLEKDFPMAVYLFDLDDLKVRNDSLGHIKGDQMLNRFGTLLRAHTRENDILARFGGDEFMVMIRQMPSGEVAERKGNEICLAVSRQSVEGGFPISCSAGVTIMRQGELFADVTRRADQALYQAKHIGKGCCCLWKDSMVRKYLL